MCGCVDDPAALLWTGSSVGQSRELIIPWSGVQVPPSLLIKIIMQLCSHQEPSKLLP